VESQKNQNLHSFLPITFYAHLKHFAKSKKLIFANIYPSSFCVLNNEAPYCTCTLQTIAQASVNIQLKTDSLISYNRTCSAFESGWGCFH
jgi:hypothetical protein